MHNDEIFYDVVEGIERDPHGPQVALDRDLLSHLGNRITVVTDYSEPMVGHGERILLAVQLLNAQAVTVTVEKVMAKDPDMHPTSQGGVTVWTHVDAKARGRRPFALCVACDHLFLSSDKRLLADILSRAPMPRQARNADTD